MERFIKTAILSFCTLVISGTPLSAATDSLSVAPREYTAVYEVLRNDNQVAKVTLELSRSGDNWLYRGYTHDMQGLASVLRVKGEQSVTGIWAAGFFQPSQFEFSFSLAGYRNRWRAEFDWQAGEVITGKKRHKTTLSLANNAMDPISLFLNTGSLLTKSQTQMELDVIDEDEIEHHLYQAEAIEGLETTLGCLATTRVDRIRKNAKRTSRAWYANDLGYIPVMLQHKKQKGKSLTMKMISLIIDGDPVQPSASCPRD